MLEQRPVVELIVNRPIARDNGGVGHRHGRAFARRGEREVFAIGAEARGGLAVRAERDLSIVPAIESGQPDVGGALVLLHVDARNHVSDRLPIGRTPGVAHLADLLEIVEAERVFRGLGSGGQSEKGKDQSRYPQVFRHPRIVPDDASAGLVRAPSSARVTRGDPPRVIAI